MLDYRASGSEYAQGATPAARIVAGVAASIFALFAWWLYTEIRFLPPVLMSVVGALFSGMVAVGTVGRHKKRA